MSPNLTTIADLQRILDKARKFQHFAIGRNGLGEYQVSYKDRDSDGYSVGTSEDLATAMATALTSYDSNKGFLIGTEPKKMRRADDDIL